MNRFLYVFIAFIVCVPMKAKKTYVPKYSAYISIICGNDTLSSAANSISLELAAKDGSFVIAVNHEDMSLNKIKSIKRAKAAAGWALFSTALSAFSTGLSSNSTEYYSRLHDTMIASALTTIYNENANAEEILGIEAYIDNTYDEELMIADLDRGLVWFVKPHSSLFIKLNNPDMLSLRVSDIRNSSVKYVEIGAGSITKSTEIEWEDEDYWAFPLYERGPSAMGTTYTEVTGYSIVHKRDGTIQNMTKKEFKLFKQKRE